MSTDKTVILSDKTGVRDIRLSVVATRRGPKEDLADFVSRVRSERRLSLSEVEANSEGGISKAYVGQIENRYVLGEAVSPQKLKALSKGLGVSEDEVFDIVRGKDPVAEGSLADNEEIAALFYDYEGLTDEDKQELRAIWNMFREEIKRRKLKPKKKR